MEMSNADSGARSATTNDNDSVVDAAPLLATILPCLLASGVCDAVSLGRLAFGTNRIIRQEAVVASEAVYKALCEAHWGARHTTARLASTGWTPRQCFEAYFGGDSHNAWNGPRPLQYSALDYALEIEICQLNEDDDEDDLIAQTLVGNAIPASFWEKGHVHIVLPQPVMMTRAVWSARATLRQIQTNRTVSLVSEWVLSQYEFDMDGTNPSESVLEDCQASLPLGRHGYAGWLRKQLNPLYSADDCPWDADVNIDFCPIDRMDRDDEDVDKGPFSVGGIRLSYPGLEDSFAAQKEKATLTSNHEMITFAHVLEGLGELRHEAVPRQSSNKPFPLQYSPSDYVLLVDIRSQVSLWDMPANKHGKALVSLALEGNEIPSFFRTGQFTLDLDEEFVVSKPRWNAKVSILLKPKQRLVNLVDGWMAQDFYDVDIAGIRTGHFCYGKSNLPIEERGYGGWLQQQLGIRFDPYEYGDHEGLFREPHLGATVELDYRSRSREEYYQKELPSDFCTITGLCVIYRDLEGRRDGARRRISFAHLLEALPQFQDY